MSWISPWNSFVMHLRIHVFPNGVERPIAYAYRTLTLAEKGYAQLEKEALSLIYGVKEFHYFLYGSIRIHSGYRTQTSIDNYRYKERIINTSAALL